MVIFRVLEMRKKKKRKEIRSTCRHDTCAHTYHTRERTEEKYKNDGSQVGREGLKHEK